MRIAVPHRVNVLGVGVHAVDMLGALTLLQAALANRTPGYVCVTGVHGVMEAQRDPELRAVLNGAMLNVPDGMPTVWMGWAEGHRGMDRVYGPDLMMAACESLRGARHFLYGGGPGVAELLKARIEERVPGVQIAGTFTPPFRPLTEDEEGALAEAVAAARVDVVWVGISTPKQERFCASHLSKLNATLLVGVGAAFDFHTGRAKDAPRWMKRAGLQWAHRLAQDPRRLAGRYLRNNPRFVVRALLQLAGVQRYSLEPLETRATCRSR
jgi:N-acetylglucosaminyldiphosphoundecaprenol N-acetyl-beta-D-mannosaminyltransferase